MAIPVMDDNEDGNKSAWSDEESNAFKPLLGGEKKMISSADDSAADDQGKENSFRTINFEQ